MSSFSVKHWFGSLLEARTTPVPRTEGDDRMALLAALYDLDAAIWRETLAELRQHDPTQAMCLALLALRTGNGCSPQELSRRIGMSAIDVVRLVDGLARRGLVMVARSGGEDEWTSVCLTKHGLEVGMACEAAGARVQRRMLHGIGEAELAALESTLRLALDGLRSDTTTGGAVHGRNEGHARNEASVPRG